MVRYTNTFLATLMLLAFFTWGGVCWYWYACSIKNMCESKETLFIPLTNELSTDDPHF